MRMVVVTLATWFGSGLAPVASGTFGTLAAIPLYLLLAQLPLGGYVAAAVVVFIVACWAADRAEEIFLQHDSGKIVIDEVAGFLVTMIAVPPSLFTVTAGFFLFRFFDITKIPPARYCDREIKNGIGVVLDDIVAGIYSCISLHLLLRFL